MQTRTYPNWWSAMRLLKPREMPFWLIQFYFNRTESVEKKNEKAQTKRPGLDWDKIGPPQFAKHGFQLDARWSEPVWFRLFVAGCFSCNHYDYRLNHRYCGFQTRLYLLWLKHEQNAHLSCNSKRIKYTQKDIYTQSTETLCSVNIQPVCHFNSIPFGFV